MHLINYNDFCFQIDKFLEELSGLTKEDEQAYHFKQMAKKLVIILSYYYCFFTF
jgi:hypothetical protein